MWFISKLEVSLKPQVLKFSVLQTRVKFLEKTLEVLEARVGAGSQSSVAIATS